MLHPYSEPTTRADQLVAFYFEAKNSQQGLLCFGKSVTIEALPLFPYSKWERTHMVISSFTICVYFVVVDNDRPSEQNGLTIHQKPIKRMDAERKKGWQIIMQKYIPFCSPFWVGREQNTIFDYAVWILIAMYLVGSYSSPFDFSYEILVSYSFYMSMTSGSRKKVLFFDGQYILMSKSIMEKKSFLNQYQRSL